MHRPAALALLLAIPSLAAAGDDPVLARLQAQAIDHDPGLAQVRSIAAAEAERVGPAGALADPVLSLGIQNDGFQGIEIGRMETSFWQVMITQPLPWPGKLDLRTEVARLQARAALAAVDRDRLGVAASVARAYVDLLLARERLALLDRRDALWLQAEGSARARYESGEGPQSDLLRAQLQRLRLRQLRAALAAAERTAVEALDRLRGRPLDEPVETPASLEGWGAPPLLDEAAALADAAARSPELAVARLAALRDVRAADLARRERFPDLAVSAGVMPRGGPFPPMWLAGVSFTLPVFARVKQDRAVAEGDARATAGAAGEQAIAELLRLRVRERREALGALVEQIGIYDAGLLVQSEATAASTLAQFRVGRVPFAALLEAIDGTIADHEGLLDALAAARRIAIAGEEVSLEPTPGAGVASPAAAGMGAAPQASGDSPPSGGAATSGSM